jgi:hypothetical protein
MLSFVVHKWFHDKIFFSTYICEIVIGTNVPEGRREVFAAYRFRHKCAGRTP